MRDRERVCVKKINGQTDSVKNQKERLNGN